MANNEQLKEEQLGQVSGGSRPWQCEKHDEVTGLLKQAGDSAWALFHDGELWNLINQAENTSTDSLRIGYIKDALNELDIVKGVLEQADYEFIYNILNECLEKTN